MSRHMHEADLGDRNSMPLSPEMQGDDGLLGPSTHNPAPSLMSRDSTHGSLAAPSTPGARSSWGSTQMLSGGGDAYAQRPPARGQSMLAQSYTSPYDDENQGYIAPAGPVPTHGDHEKPAWAAASGATPQRKRKSRKMLWALLALLALICLGVGLGVGLGLGLNKNKSTDAASSSANDNAGASTDAQTDQQPTQTTSEEPKPSATPQAKAVTGGQGSTIELDDGTTMTYENPHGGYWYYDAADPFNNGARANRWTPALNETWDYSKDIIKGVNVGGWLNTEPFIVPGLYERYANGPAGVSVDEYTMSINMGNDLEKVMTEHYDTFITERDFAEMATYGINWVRVPIGYWALEVWEGEPYLPKVSWAYVLKAIGWARKYGIRINLDLHAVPGSQNGWNHSGKIGSLNFLKGPMGLVNAQRALEYIRTLAQFIVQPEYAPVVPMFGIINEPNAGTIGGQPADGKRIVGAFYLEAYRIVREVGGTGAGNGPVVSIHDGFIGITEWYDFLRGADRLMLDQHPYLVFQDQALSGGRSLQSIEHMPCESWARSTNETSRRFGPNNAGEWSVAITDCGQWLNGVNLGSRYDGSYDGYADKRIDSCDYWNDYRRWDAPTRESLRKWTLSSMDALQNYFFWTWRIGNSTSDVPQPNPMWHYRLGVQEGWIPTNPHDADGYCVSQAGTPAEVFDFSFAPNMLGTSVQPMAAAETDPYAWPPTLSGYNSASMASIPRLTATGTPITLSVPTFTSPGSTNTIPAGNGWGNPSDNAPANTAVANCRYPAVYDTPDAIPAGACGAQAGGDGGDGGAPAPAPASATNDAPAPTAAA